MTVAELISKTRTALDKPLGTHPDDLQLRQIVFEEVQHFQNKLRISQRRGDTKSGSFTLSPGNDRTPLNAPHFGVWVYAYVEDPYRTWNQPPVRLIGAANFDQYPPSLAAIDPPDVVYGALVWENNLPYFKRRTTIARDYDCKLLYEAGVVASSGEVSLPFPEHHNYLLARCILKALPKAQWEEPDKERWGNDLNYSKWFTSELRSKRAELARPYEVSLPELAAVFDKETRRVAEPAVLQLSSGIDDEDLWL